MITNDMGRLREALALLVDESKPLNNRLDRLRPPGSKAMVPFLGPAILTAILHVVYPDRYGVLNNTLKEGKARLGLWPPDLPENSLADQYAAVNPILDELARSSGSISGRWIISGGTSRLGHRPNHRPTGRLTRKEDSLLPRRTSLSQSPRCPRSRWPARHLRSQRLDVLARGCRGETHAVLPRGVRIL